MRCKTLTAAAAVLLMLTAGCSTLERVVYRPDINQGGNYLAPNDVAKIPCRYDATAGSLCSGDANDDGSVRHQYLFYVFRQGAGPPESDSSRP